MNELESLGEFPCGRLADTTLTKDPMPTPILVFRTATAKAEAIAIVKDKMYGQRYLRNWSQGNWDSTGILCDFRSNVTAVSTLDSHNALSNPKITLAVKTVPPASIHCNDVEKVFCPAPSFLIVGLMFRSWILTADLVSGEQIDFASLAFCAKHPKALQSNAIFLSLFSEFYNMFIMIRI